MDNLQITSDITQDLQSLETALMGKRAAKLFEVRFQEIRTYKVFVEATDSKDADFMAIRELQGNPENARLVRTEYDFFTICPINPANQ